MPGPSEPAAGKAAEAGQRRSWLPLSPAYPAEGQIQGYSQATSLILLREWNPIENHSTESMVLPPTLRSCLFIHPHLLQAVSKYLLVVLGVYCLLVCFLCLFVFTVSCPDWGINSSNKMKTGQLMLIRINEKFRLWKSILILFLLPLFLILPPDAHCISAYIRSS